MCEQKPKAKRLCESCEETPALPGGAYCEECEIVLIGMIEIAVRERAAEKGEKHDRT